MLVVPPPAARLVLKSAGVTVTVDPVCVHVPFHPLPRLCRPVGQLNVSVQLLTGLVPVFVMSMLPTYPLAQSLVSAMCTAHVLVAGVPVAKVRGGEAQDTLPAESRVSTLTVYRVPGF